MDYRKLFEGLGLDAEWQTQNASRIGLFLERIRVTSQDEIDAGYERLQQQFEIALPGVRMLLSVATREGIDFVLAKDEHEIVINFGRPVTTVLSQALIQGEKKYGGKFYARGTSCLMAELLLGTVFDKMNYIVDIGEGMGQQNGRGHCSLYQGLVGGMECGMFPVPDVEIACGYFCDQAPEAEALIHELFKDKGGGYNLIFADRPHDMQWDSWPSVDYKTTELMGLQLDYAYDQLREHWGFDLSMEERNNADNLAGALTPRFMTISSLMIEAERQPVSQSDVGLVMWMWAVGSYYFDDLIAACHQFEKDIRKKIRAGEGVCSKGAPRIYTTFRYTADNSVIKFIESELDISIPVQWLDVFPHEVFTSDSNVLDSEHPEWFGYEAMTRQLTLGDNMGTLKTWGRVCETVPNLDGILGMMPMFCRPFAIPEVYGKDYIQKNYNGIPYMLYEMDSMDTRYYNMGQARTRLESFAEVVRMHKALREAGEV